MLGEVVKKLFETGITFRVILDLPYGQKVKYQREKIYSEEHRELGREDPGEFYELNPRPIREIIVENFYNEWDVQYGHKVLPEELEEFIKREARGTVYGIEIYIKPEYDQFYEGVDVSEIDGHEMYAIKRSMTMCNAARWIELHREIATR